MKKVILQICVFILISTNITIAQVMVKEGAEWHYEMTKIFSPEVGYNRYYISGDTTILGRACKILNREKSTCDLISEVSYIYEDELKVYHYDPMFSSSTEPIDTVFRLIYDFSVEEGDTVNIELDHWGTIGEEGVSYIVDSIKFVNYNDLELRQYHVRYINGREETGTIIEGIGSLNTLFHFNDTNIFPCDGRYNVGLRCYENEEVGLVKFTEIECDAEFVINSAREEFINNISIYPNPISEQFTIDFSNVGEEMCLQIIDIMGREVYKENFRTETSKEIELNSSIKSQGVYILNLYNKEKQLVYTGKIISK